MVRNIDQRRSIERKKYEGEWREGYTACSRQFRPCSVIIGCNMCAYGAKSLVGLLIFVRLMCPLNDRFTYFCLA